MKTKGVGEVFPRERGLQRGFGPGPRGSRPRTAPIDGSLHRKSEGREVHFEHAEGGWEGYVDSKWPAEETMTDEDGASHRDRFWREIRVRGFTNLNECIFCVVSVSKGLECVPES